MLVASISGVVASFILTIDKFKILKDAGYTPSCNINATLNCKSVMLSKQAEVFGFPNSIIGIGTFSMMLVIAVLLFFRISLPKLFLQIAAGGTALAVIFCHWLAYQLLVLSVLIRELLDIKKNSTEDEDSKVAIEVIKNWMVPFHIVWSALLVGAAFLGV